MKKIASTAVLAAMLSAAPWLAPAWAGNFSGGNKGSGETPRGAPGAEFSLRDVKPMETPKLDGGEEARAAPMDEGAVAKALTARGRSANGKEVTVEPSEALRDIIRRELSDGSSGRDIPGPKKADEPAKEGQRTVFGEDERVQIMDTEDYYFRTVGLILMHSSSGERRMCSGALIGPRTVLTAAHCIYDHDRGGWLEDFQFVPGARGPNAADAPFGAYDYETGYVVNGYIENYQGYYGSVLPWDLGILTLQDPVGDSLGWMGYDNYNLRNFTASMAGYPGDKPYGTMWFANCDVYADQVGASWFQNYCDTAPGMSGSAVYGLDDDGAPMIMGVNVAVAKDANTAVRLNAGYVEWINGLNQ